MKELKINPRFLEFSPKKKPDEIKTLKESLEKDGYQGAPILTWKDYIVDGHNRYKYCEELGIEIPDDKIVPLGIPETEDEIAVLLWIAKHHLSSKNLEDGEKLALMDSVRKELKKYNEQKKLEGSKLGGNVKNGNVPCVQSNTNHDTSRDRSTNTREQLSRETGVSTANIAKYDVVMKSDDEELKEKVKTGQVKIGTAYREVKKKENKEPKTSTTSSYKDVTNNYAGTQSSGHFGEYCETEKTTDKTFTEEDVIKAYEDTKTLKNALDMLNIEDEFNTFGEDVTERLNTYKNRLFNIYHIQNKISEIEKEYAIKVLSNLITNINEIINTIKGE